MTENIKLIKYNWDKLSFILDGDGNEEESYRDELYSILNEILNRIEELEFKSHMHKSQLTKPLSYEQSINRVKR